MLHNDGVELPLLTRHKRLSKVSFNEQNFVYLRAEMRSNYYSTYDDLVDPTLFNGFEYVDIINSF